MYYASDLVKLKKRDIFCLFEILKLFLDFPVPLQTAGVETDS